MKNNIPLSDRIWTAGLKWFGYTVGIFFIIAAILVASGMFIGGSIWALWRVVTSWD